MLVPHPLSGSMLATALIPFQTMEWIMKILMVLTSHDQLGNTGRKTGFWLEEFAAPYFTFLDAGATVTLASPKGGQPPIDPVSDTPEGQTDATRRFKEIRRPRPRSRTPQLDVRGRGLRRGLLSRRPRPDVGSGRGPAFDRPHRGLLECRQAGRRGLPCAGVLHRVQIQGQPLVKGKRVTGFTNGEEEAVHLTKVVPFLVEDELKRLGGLYEKAADWASFVVTDGRLVTGQNPASSRAGAEALLKLLADMTSARGSSAA